LYLAFTYMLLTLNVVFRGFDMRCSPFHLSLYCVVIKRLEWMCGVVVSRVCATVCGGIQSDYGYSFDWVAGRWHKEWQKCRKIHLLCDFPAARRMVFSIVSEQLLIAFLFEECCHLSSSIFFYYLKRGISKGRAYRVRAMLIASHAVAQSVSRRLTTMAARVRARIRSCGICSGENGAGASFIRILWFPLPNIPPIA
jgi:hypothetical protein